MDEKRRDYKTRRQALGITQQDMANRCGVSISTYRFWEYGMPPNEENEKKLEEVLSGGTTEHRTAM